MIFFFRRGPTFFWRGESNYYYLFLPVLIFFSGGVKFFLLGGQHFIFFLNCELKVILMCFPRVFRGFLEVSPGFSQGFPGVFPGFSWSFLGVSQGFPGVFPGSYQGFPGVFRGFTRFFQGFPRDFFWGEKSRNLNKIKLDKSRSLSKIVSVLLSASVKTFFVSCMRDFFFPSFQWWYNLHWLRDSVSPVCKFFIVTLYFHCIGSMTHWLQDLNLYLVYLYFFLCTHMLSDIRFELCWSVQCWY